ncbi:glycosyltransferase [Brevibacillus sp. H7]|uniref:glycosyltransferase n=1 Tax=Brevibacillus sp. H7 TaxID=3349138 RepID=UPI00381F25E7
MKILYFSTVNWKWIKQRPHFIPYYLSQQGHEVDYLSLNPIGKTVVQKLNMGRLRVIDSYVLPYSLKFRLIERMNIAYIRSRLSDKKYDIVILTNPLHHQYIPESIKSDCILVYECMDNMPYFYEGSMRDRMLSEEQKMLDIADAVITSSDKLRSELQRRSPGKQLKIKTIFNALDKETFGRRPMNIALQEPNLLYIGTIGHWLDWDILNHFAANHPEYTIYLIGPFEMKEKLPTNVVWLGTVPHHEVMDYIYSGNILLLPFRVNELTEAVDPVKLYEYLAMDKPIISAYWPELNKFACDNLKFYRNYSEFEAYALQSYYKGWIESTLNQAFIDQHHWGERVREYIEFMESIRSRKQK